MSYEAWGDDDDGLDSVREAHEKYLLEEGWLDDVAVEKLKAEIEALRADAERYRHRRLIDVSGRLSQAGVMAISPELFKPHLDAYDRESETMTAQQIDFD